MGFWNIELRARMGVHVEPNHRESKTRPNEVSSQNILPTLEESHKEQKQ